MQLEDKVRLLEAQQGDSHRTAARNIIQDILHRAAQAAELTRAHLQNQNRLFIE
jgi:hypothetical protein